MTVGPWLVRFEGVAPVAGPNWTAVEAELRASRGGGVHVLRPQSRFFTSPPTETNEAAIETLLNGQLYTVIGQADAEGRWQLRLWWKPIVTLIWLGGVLVGLGGLLAIRRTRSSCLAEEGVTHEPRLPPPADHPPRVGAARLCMAAHPAARPTVRSQLVNREVPEFVLAARFDGVPGLTSADLATGEPRLLNLFASWCVPCIAEAPVLEELAAQGREDRRDRHPRYRRRRVPRFSAATEILTLASEATRTAASSSRWGPPACRKPSSSTARA